MKKLLKLSFILLIVTLVLMGCNVDTNSDPESINTNIKQENNIDNPESILESLKGIEKAVSENDVDTFMSYQNKDNKLFYNEQLRWIQEVIYKKQHSYHIDVLLSNVQLTSSTLGEVVFQVTITKPNKQSTTNKVSYQIIKKENGWKLDDVSFNHIDGKEVTVFYSDGLQSEATYYLNTAQKIIKFYKDTFDWEPDRLYIKLYSSVEEISATVPWYQLAGWNEEGESIKVLVLKSNKDRTFQYLLHEIGHQVLSDLTNDNASLYLQEGFATFLQKSINNEESLSIHYNQASQYAFHILILNQFNFLTIEELSNKNYDESGDIYNYGFLTVNYLIQENGLDNFLAIGKPLSNYDYINKRAEHKMKELNDRSEKALEEIYGNIDKLSNNYINYYNH